MLYTYIQNKKIEIIDILFVIINRLCWSIVCVSCIVIITVSFVNLVFYIRFIYSNSIVNTILTKIIPIININSTEFKLLLLPFWLTKYLIINQILILIYYNLQFILLFFYLLIMNRQKELTSMAAINNRFHVFYLHILYLYKQFMLERTIFLFFIILGDICLIENQIKDKILFIIIYNIISTLVFILAKSCSII